MRILITLILFVLPLYSLDLEVSGIKDDVKNQILCSEKKLIPFIEESETLLPLPDRIYINNDLNPATIMITFSNIDSFLTKYVIQELTQDGRTVYVINVRPLASFVHFGLDKWLDFICFETGYSTFLKMNVLLVLTKENGNYISFTIGPKIIGNTYDPERTRILYNYIILGDSTNIKEIYSNHDNSWIFEIAPYEDLRGDLKPDNVEYLKRYFYE